MVLERQNRTRCWNPDEGYEQLVPWEGFFFNYDSGDARKITKDKG